MEWPSSDPAVHSSLSAPLLPACGFAPQDQHVLLYLPSSWLHNPVIDPSPPPPPTTSCIISATHLCLGT